MRKLNPLTDKDIARAKLDAVHVDDVVASLTEVKEHLDQMGYAPGHMERMKYTGAAVTLDHAAKDLKEAVQSVYDVLEDH